jgi:hypothetical protein
MDAAQSFVPLNAQALIESRQEMDSYQTRDAGLLSPICEGCLEPDLRTVF